MLGKFCSTPGCRLQREGKKNNPPYPGPGSPPEKLNNLRAEEMPDEELLDAHEIFSLEGREKGV